MAQFCRPDSDLAAGAWTAQGGPTALYDCVDETSASDTDYMQLNNSAGSTAQLRLSDVTDPVSSSNHIVRVRGRKAGTGTISCTAYLYQGGTQICTFSVTLGTGFATTTYTLSTAEADSISDYTDLRLHLTGVCNSATRFVGVSWAEFEVPAASSIYDDALTVARSAGMSEAESLTVSESTTLPKSLGVTSSNLISAQDATTLNKQLGIAESGGLVFEVDVTISRSARIGG